MGLVTGLNGDIGAAALALYGSMTKAEQLGDIAGNISFATWLANGMSLHGMADRALPVIENAMELARKSGYPEIPLELLIAKVRALTNLPEPKADQNRDAAEKLIAATIAQAEKQTRAGCTNRTPERNRPDGREKRQSPGGRASFSPGCRCIHDGRPAPAKRPKPVCISRSSIATPISQQKPTPKLTAAFAAYSELKKLTICPSSSPRRRKSRERSDPSMLQMLLSSVRPIW